MPTPTTYALFTVVRSISEHHPASRPGRESVIADALLDVGALARAGLLGPMRPDHAVRALVDVYRWGPLAGGVQAQAVRHADRVALVDDEGELTFAEVHR